MESVQSRARTGRAEGPYPVPHILPVNSSKQLSPHQQRGAQQGADKPTDSQRTQNEWVKLQSELDSDKKLETNIRSLYEKLVSVLDDADKHPDKRQGARDQIASFLSGDADREKSPGNDKKEDVATVDDCVRWVILYVAVSESVPSDHQNTIMTAILEERGYLAFENLNDPSIKNSCRAPKHHSKCKTLRSQKRCILHRAAEVDNASAISTIPSLGKKFCGRIQSGKIQRPEPEFWDRSRHATNATSGLLQQVAGRKDNNGQTALSLAAGGDDEDYEALEMLLTELPGLVLQDEDTFDKALDEKKFNVAKIFLVPDVGQERFATREYILKALKTVPSGGEERPNSEQMQMVWRLISLATKRKKLEEIDINVVSKLIELGLVETWKKIAQDVTEGVKKLLLHLAVVNQQFEFVEIFLHDYPGLVDKRVKLPPHTKDTKESDKGYYPLWYNNNRWDEAKGQWTGRKEYGSARVKIRSSMVHGTIQRVKNMQELSNILHQSGEPGRELCFDLSGFDTKRNLLPDFVKLLVNDENRNLVTYEETLRYAEFPALDLNVNQNETLHDNAYLASEHKEIFEILDWLRNEHVRNIISLKVPDRLMNPHSEDRIAQEVERFKVEILDWRFLDMSIHVLQGKGVRERIRELHLYASGKRAPIRHWLSSDGVNSLTKLEKLTVHVVKELGTEGSCLSTVRYIDRELKALKLKNVKVSVTAEFWNRAPKQFTLNELAQRVAPKLSRFIQSYRGLAHRRHGEDAEYGFRPIKVAIIDNGILSVASKAHDSSSGPSGSHEDLARSPRGKQAKTDKASGERSRGSSSTYDFFSSESLSSRIELGRSFVDDNFKLSPWFFASNPHGTQMANLICAMDPLCKLYVAKVAENMTGVTPQRAARAIEWAITHDVDVISMSFTTLEDTEDLMTQIQNATQKKIVMICSTHDEGSRVVNAYPADYKTESKLVIAACDKYGKLWRDVESRKYDYKVDGVEVPAGIIPFLESTDRISGSSVATALVAGLASLILSCHRLAHPDSLLSQAQRFMSTDQKSQDPISIVKRHLDDMSHGKSDGPGFIFLERFAGIDGMIKAGEDVDAETVLKKAFKMKSEGDGGQ